MENKLKNLDLARVIFDAAITVKEKMSELVGKMPHVSGEGQLTPISYTVVLEIADKVIKKVKPMINPDKNIGGNNFELIRNILKLNIFRNGGFGGQFFHSATAAVIICGHNQGE